MYVHCVLDSFISDQCFYVINTCMPDSSQCFCQTGQLWESRVAFREGPQKNGERANLALYFYKAACRLNPGIVFYM